MRLSKEEIGLLKSTLKTFVDDARLYLFGSRVDDSKQGGDIDILVVSKDMTKKEVR